MSIKTTIAKEVVKGRIRKIAEKDGIPVQNIYAVIDVSSSNGNFAIWLYNKSDLTKPIREIELGELL
jgi:hypothetical protein